MKFYDTCALLNLRERAFEEPFYISSVTLTELEDIKTSAKKDEETKWKARQVVKLLSNNNCYKIYIPHKEEHDLITELELEITNDTLIIASAYAVSHALSNVVFITDDLLCYEFAKDVFGIPVCKSKLPDVEKYTGYLEVMDTDDRFPFVYENPSANVFDALQNQYIVVRNKDGEVVDRLRWNGEEYKPIAYKTIKNSFLGKIKPRNDLQMCVFDMLQNEDITIKVVTGGYGTGKDYCMISNALNLVEQNKYDKIIWVRNNIEVKNSQQIGYLPGDLKDKLLPFAMVMADHLGGQSGLEMLMGCGKIEIQHLGFIRGRDLKNSIVICSEAENMTKEHIQLLIGRIGEGSTLWLNGDYRQTDKTIFENNNGLIQAIERLKGHPRFGFVKLEQVERSETASMADLLD